MCGRYAVFTEEENQELREIINNINERYKDDLPKMKTGEIFPTNVVPVITGHLENKRTVNLFKWGFPNYRQASGVIINARCETLHEKPTFRKLLTSGRCLVPASGFYEWKATEAKKEKYFIRPSNTELMYFAGLYNTFIDKSGIPFTNFVIITTEANDQMSQIHTRMPVILSSTETTVWINQTNVENVSNTGIGINTGFSNILRPSSSELVLEKVG
ncbi:MAG TPA: SOS response-associated peptidase [Ruminiclostridium sp.]